MCRSDTECAGGLFCFINSAGGTCRPYCDQSTGCSGDGSACISLQFASDGGSTDTGAFYCTDVCDPLDSENTCEHGQGCSVGVNGAMPFTQCLVQGDTPIGSACTLDNDCMVGALCASSGAGDSTCRQICELSASSPVCAEGTCTGVGAGLVIGAVEYGVCI